MKKLYINRAKTEIAGIKTIRNINKQIVLNYIRDCSPISRAEIAKETTLNRSTVSAIVEALHSDGFIEEVGIGNSSGGRKPVLLKLKTGKPVAVGIDITPRSTTIAVADLGGKFIEKETLDTVSDIDEMTDLLLEKVSRITKSFKKYQLEIGISVPGITDYITGKVLYIPYFGWRSWDIRELLAKKTGLDVTIENDANATALAELWFGSKKIRNIKNFIAVLVGEGIGTGIIFDGQIYRGERGAAGEFGHMTVGDNAPVYCSCGSRTCWEALSSEKAILARYQQLAAIRKDCRNCLNIGSLVEMARAGDKNALQVLQETGKFLGIGISNLIVGLSPQAVVVSGEITDAWKIFADQLTSSAESSVRNGLSTPFLMTSTLGKCPTLIGAVTLVLARKFASA